MINTSLESRGSTEIDITKSPGSDMSIYSIDKRLTEGVNGEGWRVEVVFGCGGGWKLNSIRLGRAVSDWVRT